MNYKIIIIIDMFFFLSNYSFLFFRLQEIQKQVIQKDMDLLVLIISNLQMLPLKQ